MLLISDHAKEIELSPVWREKALVHPPWEGALQCLSVRMGSKETSSPIRASRVAKVTALVPPRLAGQSHFSGDRTSSATRAAGSCSVRLDGREMGYGRIISDLERTDEKSIMDLYVPYRTLSQTFSSSVVTLNKGDHLMSLRYEGDMQNDAGTTAGIDFIWVKKQ